VSVRACGACGRRQCACPRPASRSTGARRRRLRACWLLALLAVACSKNATEPRPNVLLVVLDTTRADALSSYGNPKPTTPHVDRLAREGVRFTRAFSSDFWTLPSHASLLTGLYPSEHRATSETNRLPADSATLAEALRRGGYRTGAFVSNAWLSEERGFARGFETYREMWRDPNAGDDPMLDRKAVAGAIEWLAERSASDPPFFLFLNLNTAHLPYSPDPIVHVDLSPRARPIERVARLKQIKGMWSHLGGAESFDALDFEILRELYESEVAMVDALVGRLVTALEERDLLDDTLIVVTSDHGENIGEHGMIDHLLSMYETTLHVPLVMRYPRVFPAGSVDSELASLIDVAPTILDVSGLAAQAPNSVSRSLARRPRSVREFVIAENDRPLNGIDLMRKQFPDFDTRLIDRRIRTLRTQRHKLVWYSDGEVELFDLDADPREESNLAASRPELRDSLLGILEDWMQQQPEVETPGIFQGRDEEALERLRALGYVE